jgi:uncharacterized peroxidase-related enzyme
MTRDDERRARANEAPIVGGLPDAPGIRVAMLLTPGLGVHLRGLADELLVHDYPGATIDRVDRELIATAVSAANDCFFCMDSHGAHAAAVMQATGRLNAMPAIEILKDEADDGLDAKLAALVRIARIVRRAPRELTVEDVEAAAAAGASDGDVQLAVLIAAGFSMYNRMVDGFRAGTAPSIEAYAGRAAEIAAHGYS